MNAEIPVACYLNDRELQARRKNYLDQAAESLIDSAELSDGFVFRFPRRDETLQTLAEIVDLERKSLPVSKFSNLFGSRQRFRFARTDRRARHERNHQIAF